MRHARRKYREGEELVACPWKRVDVLDKGDRCSGGKKPEDGLQMWYCVKQGVDSAAGCG